MDRLRDDLPVIANSTRDVASQIGHAGGVAKEQLEELVTGFNRLNEFGEASGRQVATLRDKIAEALTRVRRRRSSSSSRSPAAGSPS
jgi:hypothetical protein